MLLALRLAWRQLRSGRAKLISAIAGVLFACLLVFMQLGFRAALFEAASNLAGSMRGQLFLIHPLTQVLFRAEPFPRSRAYQALAVPGVAQAVPIYLSQVNWRNPQNGTRRSIQLIGFDPQVGALSFPGLAQAAEALTAPDTLAFDIRSRPEFGDVKGMFDKSGPFDVQVGDRRMRVVGLVEVGASFAADGNAVMSEINIRRIVKEKQANKTDLVALRLADGADIAATRAALRPILPDDVMVLTQPELVAWEKHYWETGTPIGFIFAFGSAMGLVVGMVIVYQILFSDIANHLKEYATLKAMGYSTMYLCYVVMGAALILAILGFVPGLLATLGLYHMVAKATFLPLYMDPVRGVEVFGLIAGMCIIAGMLAMRKLSEANPADMF
jgi:putative ABC transport system permease protein